MVSPNEKLASSLEELHALQQDGRRVFRSSELTRTHRERLVQAGYLKEIMRGWLISSSPNVRVGDTTPWYASFWEFCAAYCNERFGDRWSLSAEQSLSLYAEETAVPRQVIVWSTQATGNLIRLPENTSIYETKIRTEPPAVEVRDGLRLLSLSASLVGASIAFYRSRPIVIRAALAAMKSPAEVLAILLDGGHTEKAGVIAGALGAIGRGDWANEIVDAMKAAHHAVRITNPFDGEIAAPAVVAPSPIVGRLRSMWDLHRDAVIRSFPAPPGVPADHDAYLQAVDDIYKHDAYHSLSIEGYRVTPDLIERVRAGTWDAEANATDNEQKNAMAAKGYWDAFQIVRSDVARIVNGESAGAVVREDHNVWYRALFQQFVSSGVMRASALAGYRSTPVFINQSRHLPPRKDVVPDAMGAFFELLAAERDAGVRAVLGHWMLGYIHPYSDGNGRVARFLMNTMLASGGYPWTVIRVEDRAQYMAALESASVDEDLAPFAQFIAERVKWAMDFSAKPKSDPDDEEPAPAP
ncbi:Fic family protein [Roseiterribacter gracilis]|uniref:Fido domain-containing protein n=1 Tax=Roseiterribacter gracilis TaxID=2812848 RepID=A0A8S8XIU8_9PROT|nr:hypothetical protein TMPK1_29170 [Rhodospirillales bacterium TMPK1]